MKNYKNKYLKYKKKYLQLKGGEGEDVEGKTVEGKTVEGKTGELVELAPLFNSGIGKIYRDCGERKNCKWDAFYVLGNDIMWNFGNRKKTQIELLQNILPPVDEDYKRRAIEFYKTKVIEHNNGLSNEQIEDIFKFDIFKGNICVLIGPSEHLAPFILYLHNELININNSTGIDYSNFDIRTLEKESKKKLFLVSSMKEDNWTPENNQSIIMDGIYDEKKDGVIDTYNIINGMLCLVFNEKIHNDKGKLQLEYLLKKVKCRVTYFEICFIINLIVNHKVTFNVYFYQVTDSCYIYFLSHNIMSRELAEKEKESINNASKRLFEAQN